MRIYLVVGETGEYSDRATWVAKAFKKEINAIEYCDLVNKFGGFKDMSTFLNYETTTRLLEILSRHDPKAQMDYTGTWYEIQSLEVEDGN